MKSSREAEIQKSILEVPKQASLPDRHCGFREFLKAHQDELLNIGVWAAFGFKNNSERAAVALLHEYNAAHLREKTLLENGYCHD